MEYRIRPCTREDTAVLVEIIRGAFRDVAERFGLNENNCPRHASNCTAGWIEKDMDRGVAYFLLEADGQAAGSVAVERAKPDVVYLERLAVLSRFRGRGFGKALVAHALAEARAMGAKSIGIGVIAGETGLKEWYRRQGFAETQTRDFDHLPFRVSFMHCPLG
jgi:ribosomal protein S18 acetylase RimI-like enzyme